MNIEIAISFAIGGVIGGFGGWFGKLLIAMAKVKFKSSEDSKNEKLKADLEYKTYLKQEEYVAAKVFNKIFYKIKPSVNFPDMDHYEACNDIAYRFERIEIILNDFLSEHSVILEPKIRNEIQDAAIIASYGKLEITSPDISDYANSEASKMYGILCGVKKVFEDLAEKQKNIN
ncbi:hypothetical protein [Maridesulfovibrio salexigens]|uniref:Uncharacterized protein n=1 Tax=Maridesulfovibrio salexigens (strain ATCC 14822 / DSM 2638 / NCIMB 8403 / VKM B-1763) TaxID=526222 RepID=C6BVZ7_MARSD|nr:hypothetical protein [Maridesulfovibrio salexigens]ACS80200.1 hypothetical protein Desal_2141 [Maridesulfovibrio salexigens DSM 2638]